jgi:hypothetical protein
MPLPAGKRCKRTSAVNQLLQLLPLENRLEKMV